MRWTGLRGRPWRGQSQTSGRLGLWLEALLLFVLAIQFARLVWAVLAPVGQFGDWRARQPVMLSADARRALFTTFDPFFRGAPVGNEGEAVQQVTALPLQLFGIRVNESSGLGSAIIADESGVQKSYAVGEEIAPGVTLKAVTYDHVVISRGGVDENLFMDQSSDVAPVGNSAAPSPSAGPAAAAVQGGPPAPQELLDNIDFVPRTEKGRITGIVVNARNNPVVFDRAGFRPGDIVVQVNGRPVSSAADISNVQQSIKPGARLSFMVERGASTVPIALIIPDEK